MKQKSKKNDVMDWLLCNWHWLLFIMIVGIVGFSFMMGYQLGWNHAAYELTPDVNQSFNWTSRILSRNFSGVM